MSRTSWSEHVIVGWALRSVPRDGQIGPHLASDAESGVEIVLVVGNDDRALSPADVADVFGPLTARRADVVILLAVDRPRNEIRAVSLPRDLSVDTSEYGPLLLGEAFGFGGVALLVRSIEQLTGVIPQHYVEWSFGGFAELIDELGGLVVDFCRPTRDGLTGLNVPAGASALDGEEALALVRSRSYERLEGGVWVDGGQGDRYRVERQHAVWAKLVQRLSDDIGVGDLVDLVRGAGSLVVVDPRLSADDVLDLLDISTSGQFSIRSMAAVPIRSQDERRSPFGADHLGGRLYLQPALNAGDSIQWLVGAKASEPASTQPAVGSNNFSRSQLPTTHDSTSTMDRESDDPNCI